MTAGGSDGGDRRPVDRRMGTNRAVRIEPGVGADRRMHAGSPRDAETIRLDAHVLEAVEYAGVLAEESVVPHVRRRGPSDMRGSSSVMIDLRDVELTASFRRLGLLRRCPTFRCWTVDRRWSGAFGDLELDERMCERVATHLAATFPGRLRTRVISLIDRA